jgi:DNA replication protein DnaC
VRETLVLLCEREIARKDHRRIEMAPKLAHFPAGKEQAGFDFEAQPSIDTGQIRDSRQVTLDCQRRERALNALRQASASPSS